MTWLLIVSMFAVDPVRAASPGYTGQDCYTKHCTNPRHVRMNAVFEAGRIIGGCNCVCDPELSTSCVFPTEFDNELCTCGCPSWRPTYSEVFIRNACGSLAEFDHNTCKCLCPTNLIRRCADMGGSMSAPPDCRCTECPFIIENCPKPGHIQNLKTCNCECPPWSPTEAMCRILGKVLRDCECGCPVGCHGPGQIQDPATCQCGCPSSAPDPSTCLKGMIDPLTCRCEEDSPYCCLAAMPDAKVLAGRCWRHRNAPHCLQESKGACVWDNTGFGCLPDPPVNSLDRSRACAFRNDPCLDDIDCCSEVCRWNGLCQ